MNKQTQQDSVQLTDVTLFTVNYCTDCFSFQVVTAHAVTVPVTPQLSSDDAGFLPIHCVHQLLRSRAFTKHAVPVKVRTYNSYKEERLLSSVLSLAVNGFCSMK